MAFQTPTSGELMAVERDPGLFFLPFEASLDLTGAITGDGATTVYGVTDPAVDLSVVNVRHLKTYTSFRGTWSATPNDGNDADGNSIALPYDANDIIAHTDSSVGGNNVIYIRSAANPNTNPRPDMDDGSHWTPLGLIVNPGTVTDSNSEPGIYLDQNGTRLNFRGYVAGNGIGITDNEISVQNMSITDVHVYSTRANWLAGLDNDATGTAVVWHQGDVAVVNSTVAADQGTFIYTNSTSRTGATTYVEGATSGNDWTRLALPGNLVNMVAGTPGPIVTTQNIVDAINADTFTGGQVLTEAEATRVGSRYSGTGAPAANFAMTTRQTGDVYIDTTNNTEALYFFNGSEWQRASASMLRQIDNVHITADPGAGQHLIWSNDVNEDGSNVRGWVAHDATLGTSIALQNLSNVENVVPDNTDTVLIWNSTAQQWQPGNLSDFNIRGYTYNGSSEVNINGLPSGSNSDSIPKVFTGNGSPSNSTTGVSGFSGEGIRHRGDLYIDIDADVLFFFDGTQWGRASAATLGAIPDVMVDSTIPEHNILQRNNANRWINVTPATMLNRESASELSDILYTTQLPATTTYSLITEEGLASTVRVQSQETTNPTGHAFTGFGGNLDFSGVNVDDRVYFAPTMGSSLDPSATGVLGPFRVTGTTSNNRTLFIARNGADAMTDNQRADIIGTAHYVWLVGSERTPLDPGDILTWNGDNWINTSFGNISLEGSPLSLLSDVNYDDDVESLLYSVTVRDADRLAADRVAFGPTRTQMVDGSSETVATLFASTGNGNFQLRDFAIDDVVYLSENAPPITGLVAEDDGPYRVVDLAGNNPVFVIGTATDQVPLGIHNFVDGSRNYWAYIEIPANRGVVRPADVLVRSNDGEFWINETAAQMASNPNGGILLQNLRDVSEVHRTAPEFMGTATGVTINSATRTTPASITLTISANINPNPNTNELLRFSNSGIIYRVVSYTPNFVVSRNDNLLISDADLADINANNPTIETGVFGTIELPLDRDEILTWDSDNNTWRNRTLAEVSNRDGTGIGLNDLNDTVVPTDTTTIVDNSVLHWSQARQTWEPVRLGSAQLGNADLEDIGDVTGPANNNQVLVYNTQGTPSPDDDRWVPTTLEIDFLNDVNITGETTVTTARNSTSLTAANVAFSPQGQSRIVSIDAGSRAGIAVGTVISFSANVSAPVYNVLTTPTGSTVFTVERRDGEDAVLSDISGNTIYIAPTTEEPPQDNEFLSYSRTARAWVNVPSTMLQSHESLIWTDSADTNSTTLTGYRQGGTVRPIRDTNFITNPVQTDPGIQLMQLVLATFDGSVGGFANRSLSWDTPYTRATSQNSSFSLGVTVDNPMDFPAQFINAVTAISADNGNSLALANFDSSSPNVPPAGGVDWNQRFILSTGEFIQDSTTALLGGDTNIRYTLSDNQGGTYTATQRISWGDVEFDGPTLVGYPTSLIFYRNVPSINFEAHTTGIGTPANSTMSATDTNDIFSNINSISGSTSITRLSASNALQFDDPVYKDATPAGALTVTYQVTRPANVTGTSYTQSDTRTLDQTDWVIPTITYPQLYIDTPSLSTLPTAYATSTNATALLTGDFDMNSITTQTGVNTWNTHNPSNETQNDITVNPTTTTVYWFGRRGTRPTVLVNSGLGFLAPTQTNTTHTVDFHSGNMTGANLPSGWVDNITYNFIGVLVNAGSHTIRIT